MKERRNKERRKSERRKQDLYCMQCGEALKYYIPDKPTDRETLWCEACQQMYVLVAQRMEVPYLAKVGSPKK